MKAVPCRSCHNERVFPVSRLWLSHGSGWRNGSLVWVFGAWRGRRRKVADCIVCVCVCVCVYGCRSYDSWGSKAERERFHRSDLCERGGDTTETGRLSDAYVCRFGFPLTRSRITFGFIKMGTEQKRADKGDHVFVCATPSLNLLFSERKMGRS